MWKDLATHFLRGQYRVRTADDPGGGNCLEFLEHVHNPTVEPKENNPLDSPQKSQKIIFKKCQKVNLSF